MAKISAAGRNALDEFVAQTQKDNKIPGFVIGVTNAEGELYFSAGGHRIHNDPTSGPVTRDSVFWLCSMTKLITTIAALQLIEQGKLSVDDPVAKYLPQFKDAVVIEGAFVNPNPTYKPVQTEMTVFHLLTQTSGLSYFSQIPEPAYRLPSGVSFRQGPTREATREKFLEELKEGYPGIRLISEPGEAFTYGYSSDVLGIVIEIVSGLSLADYSENNIFKPLGVETTFKLNAELSQKLVELVFRNSDGSISHWDDQVPLPARYPEEVFLDLGGIGTFSTLPDYLIILRHLLRIEAGKEVSNPVLTQKAVKSLFQPQIIKPEAADQVLNLVRLLDPVPTKYEKLNWSTGLALSTTDWLGNRKAYSGFWSGWAGTCFFVDPTTGLGLVSGNQIVPGVDAGSAALFNKFEEIVYANLEEDYGTD